MKKYSSNKIFINQQFPLPQLQHSIWTIGEYRLRARIPTESASIPAESDSTPAESASIPAEPASVLNESGEFLYFKSWGETDLGRNDRSSIVRAI